MYWFLCLSSIAFLGWAQFWATTAPFLVALPFQTGAWITYFSNWTSLIFQSMCNFAAPFLVYLFLPKRNLVMQQSVLEELEFLDLDAGVKKWRDDEDDFDYVYHLPHADMSRLGMRRYDPFAVPAPIAQASQASLAPGISVAGTGGSSGAQSVAQSQYLGRPKFGMSVSQMSSASGASARQLMRQMLGPGGGGGSRRRIKDNSQMPSMNASRRTSLTASKSGLNLSPGGLGVPEGASRRLSVMMMPGNLNKIHPVTDMDDVEAKGVDGADLMKPPPYVEDVTGDLGHFRAIPYWVTKRIHPSWIAASSLVLTMGAAVIVFVMDIQQMSK